MDTLKKQLSYCGLGAIISLFLAFVINGNYFTLILVCVSILFGISFFLLICLYFIKQNNIISAIAVKITVISIWLISWFFPRDPHNLIVKLVIFIPIALFVGIFWVLYGIERQKLKK
jgi:hypothetical protein